MLMLMWKIVNYLASDMDVEVTHSLIRVGRFRILGGGGGGQG